MKKNHTTFNQSHGRFITSLLGIYFLAASAAFGEATVKTDKLDYAPGETVIITGTDWKPGEEVSLWVMNLTIPELNILDRYAEWFVTADALGNISSYWDVTIDELGTELVLTALGQESGYEEQVFFTDASEANHGDGEMTVDPSEVCGEVTEYRFTFIPGSGNYFPAGSEITFKIPEGWPDPGAAWEITPFGGFVQSSFADKIGSVITVDVATMPQSSGFYLDIEIVDPGTNYPEPNTYIFEVKTKSGLGAYDPEPITSGFPQIMVDAVGGTVSGGFTSCSSSASGSLLLENYSGTDIEWYESIISDSDGFAPVTGGGNAANGTELQMNNITTTTWFKALVTNGDCEAWSDVAVVYITTIPGITATDINGECNETIYFGEASDLTDYPKIVPNVAISSPIEYTVTYILNGTYDEINNVVTGGTQIYPPTYGGFPSGESTVWVIAENYCSGSQGPSISSFTVTAGDSKPPVLKIGEDIPDGDSEMDLCFGNMPEGPTAAEIALLYEDNCGTVLVDKYTTVEEGSDDCHWSVTYTYDVYDDADPANHVDPSPTIVYSGGDETPPALTGDAYAQLGSVDDCMPTQEEAIAMFSSDNALEGYSDLCSGTLLTADLTNTLVEGTDCGWTITYTYTVKDVCLNEFTGQQYTTAGADITPPALTGDAYAQLGSVDDCMPTQEEAIAMFSSDNALEGYSDLCSGTLLTAELTNTLVEGTDCDWTITYTYTVKDVCLNAFTGQQYTTVGADITPPALTGDAYAQLGSVDDCMPTQEEAIAMFSSDNALEGYSDLCSGTLLTADLTNTLVEGTDCDWTITYTYTVKDVCLNEFTGQQYTTAGADITPPALTGDAYAQLGSVDDCMPTQEEAIAVFSSDNALEGYSDLCSGTLLTAELTNTLVEGTDCDWTITYTYTVKDVCLNAFTGQQYTTVGADITPPALTGDAYAQLGSVDDCMPTQEEAIAMFSSDNALEGYSDLCSGTLLTADLTNTLVEGTDCGWTITYTYTVKDVCLNEFTGQQYTTVGADITPPNLKNGMDIPEGEIEMDLCEAPAGPTEAEIAALYEDNCSSVITVVKSGSPTGDECEWSVTYTYEVTDECGNPVDPSPTISYNGGDLSAPTFDKPEDIACGGSETFYTHLGECTYDPGTGFDIINIDDNCDDDVTVTVTLSEATTMVETELSSLSGIDFNPGVTTVTWKAKDNCENVSTCSFVVEVKISTETTVNTSAQSTRYLDYITLYANVGGLWCNDDYPLTGEVFFEIGGVPVGSAPAYPIPFGEIGNPDYLRATLIVEISDDFWNELVGQAPNVPDNPYKVTAEFVPASDYYEGSDDETDLNIYQRDAVPFNGTVGFYTGDIIGWITSDRSNTATITLAATMKDSEETGDVRGARATFCFIKTDDEGNAIFEPIPGAANLPVGLIDQLNSTVGFASADVQINISKNSEAESFDIAVLISGGYSNSPLTSKSYDAITIARSIDNGSILGAGNFLNTSESAGIIKGANGEVVIIDEYGNEVTMQQALTNFNFYVQYNKKATNPQGYFNMTVISWYDEMGILDNKLHTYFIKTNAINNFIIGPFEKIILDGQAIFEAKANIKELVELEDELTGDPIYKWVDVEGNAPIMITMSDLSGEGADPIQDQIGITYYHPEGGIWFSNNWDPFKLVTNELVINNGDIQVANDGAVTKPPKKAVEINKLVDNASLKVYPNPFSELLQFEFESPEDGSARLDMYDVTGRLIETVFEGPVKANHSYFAKFKPESSVSSMYFYRLTMGDNVFNGKVMYKD